MKEDFREKQRRKSREERSGMRKGCFHDKDHWCQNCVGNGMIHVDFRKEGLGQGHIFTNIPPNSTL